MKNYIEYTNVSIHINHGSKRVVVFCYGMQWDTPSSDNCTYFKTHISGIY